MLWECQKTIYHSQPFLGACFKTYFGWKCNFVTPATETAEAKKQLLFNNAWKPYQKIRLDGLVIVLID